MEINQISAKFLEIVSLYGIRVITAIIILVFGRWAARVSRDLIQKILTKNEVDQTLVKFVCGLSYIAFLAFVVIAALNQLGIQTASFIAIVGAAGLAVGLALKDSLSNFASGLMMIVFKPFRVGDFVEAGGTSGEVEEIQIFTTRLKTPDNKTVIIPNSKVMGDNITNYTLKGSRRVDMVFGIGYQDDIDKVRQLIRQIVTSDPRVFKDPEPVIAVSALADNSVNLTTRVWTSANDYWNVLTETTEKVKKRFDAENISIPFPQRDVHLYKH